MFDHQPDELESDLITGMEQYLLEIRDLKSQIVKLRKEVSDWQLKYEGSWTADDRVEKDRELVALRDQMQQIYSVIQKHYPAINNHV